MQRRISPRSAFTLIELLIVIAIVSILAIVVLLALNPAQLLKQSRDANRLSELSTLNQAISLHQTDQGGFLGAASTTYVSIPDTTSTCANLGLPAQSSGWVYACVTTTTLRKTDGTGWIPINFQAATFGAPLGTLPIDSVNTTSTGNYYTYTTDGSQWVLTAVPESLKQRLQYQINPIIQNSPGVYAVGSNLAMPSIFNPAGLVGYWNFEVATGTAVADLSGNGNNGTWSGSSVSRYTTGKVGNYAGQFNGSNDVITVPDNGTILDPSAITMSAWVFPTINQAAEVIAKNGNSGYRYRRDAAKTVTFYDRGGTNAFGSVSTIPSNTWSMVTVTGDSSGLRIYLNGTLNSSGAAAYSPGDNSASLYIGAYAPGSEGFAGSIDDTRVYNRALSAGEIGALYNATR